jgi:hypothetical protein
LQIKKRFLPLHPLSQADVLSKIEERVFSRQKQRKKARKVLADLKKVLTFAIRKNTSGSAESGNSYRTKFFENIEVRNR